MSSLLAGGSPHVRRLRRPVRGRRRRWPGVVVANRGMVALVAAAWLGEGHSALGAKSSRPCSITFSARRHAPASAVRAGERGSGAGGRRGHGVRRGFAGGGFEPCGCCGYGPLRYSGASSSGGPDNSSRTTGSGGRSSALRTPGSASCPSPTNRVRGWAVAGHV